MAYLPVTYDSNGFFRLNSEQSAYIGYKPKTYNESTPISLFVWMHGCGGNAEGDLWSIAPPATRETQSYIAISLGGRDGACWQTNNDGPKVLAAIEDVKKYFNINPRKIYLGGYSSGGDMTYRIGMANAGLFAGLLIENSDAWGSGVSVNSLIASASWKINIAQLNHLSDNTYPIGTARNNLTTLKNAGFPVVAIEKPGTHYDTDTATSGTNYDLKKFLLPYLDAGWTLPSAEPPPPPNPYANITPTTSNVKAPGDQGYTSKKIVADGYSIPKGTYTLTAATRTTYSDNSSVVVDVILYSNQTAYDVVWESMQIDLRGHTIDNFWNCTIEGASGVVTVKPTANTKKIPALNKNAFGFTFKRMSDPEKSYYQVLVKSIKW